MLGRINDKHQVGYEEGNVCGRDGCDGTITDAPVENCSCHISAPCSQCVENRFYCSKCDWRAKDDE